MACRSIVLLVEELVVGVVDTVREENAYKDLGVVDLDVVGWVGIAHVVLGKSLGLGVFLVDRETSGEVGRVGETFVPNGHLIEVAAFVERDDAMLRHVLHISYGGRIVSELYGEAKRTIVQNLVSLVAVRQELLISNHEAGCAKSEGGSHTVRVETIAVVEVEGGGDIYLVRLCLQSLDLCFLCFEGCT